MLFKLPSVDYLITQSKASLQRFPLIIVSAVVASVLSIFLVEIQDDVVNRMPYINSLLSTALGIPLFYCLKTVIERKEITGIKLAGVNMIGVLALVLVYFSLPGTDSTTNISLPYIRYAVFNISIHLMVSFAPFLSHGELNGFWQYNKNLFLRFCQSVLYSGFLYLGLVLALSSLHLLFDVKIKGELYFELFIVVIGIFNTWFFVSGVPKNTSELDGIEDYPKGLKIFTQYVLIPLLVLYLVILFSYVVKILVLWDWPRGIVSYLILCVAMLGIFTLLLIHPFGSQQESTWIKNISRFYYYLLLPLIILLFIAIGMRIEDYGVTVNRYIIVMMGIWLAFICLYFIAGRKNIKAIPVSLSLIILLCSFGPWSMFSVSEKSQVNRLEEILKDGGLLNSGKIKNEALCEVDTAGKYSFKNKEMNEGVLSDSLHNEVKSILDYLDRHHGFDDIDSWHTQNVDSLIQAIFKEKGRWTNINESELYMNILGLRYHHIYDKGDNKHFNFTSKNQNEAQSVGKYSYFIPLNIYRNNQEQYVKSYQFDSKELELTYTSNTLSLSVGGYGDLSFDIGDLYGLVQNASNKTLVEESFMTIEASNGMLEAKLKVNHFSGSEEQGSAKVNSINGYLFLRLLDQQ
ncbi:DUF4153 domain-containing protein [Reichenbachiella sp. MALMAid0571]|uniref:DUF4153 domain-containing protein n=1 Tax=Reichenbachiella sp. MALMAid0571 TaxID=3143939 RepID=UPI0032DE9920